MENQHSKIDEIFRQRLHDSEVPPPPFVWPAVEQELQKRRRKGLFLWLFAFGTASACVLFWQFGTWHKTTSGPVLTSEVLSQSKALETDLATPTSDSKISSPGQSTGKVEVTAAELPANIATQTSQASKESAKKASHLNASEFKNESKRASNAPKIIFSPKGAPAEEKSTISNPAKAEIKPDLETILANNPAIALEILAIDGLDAVGSLTDKTNPFAPKITRSRAHRKKVQPRLCYDFTRHPSAWLLDVYAGPSLAQRSLNSRQDDEPYLNQRLATEHRSTAMNAGVRASLMFNRNFLIRTGLHFDQVTEVFEFIDPTSVTYILKFTPGDPIPDTLGVQYGENYLKTYNRYQMVDVPLMLGVEMRQGRSGFSINAGITANVMFKKRGVIIDPNTQEPGRFGPVPEKPKGIGPGVNLSQDIFRSNIGLSATASIQWYYHLSPHWRLFAEPSFRQVLRPVTLSNHPVEQRYSIMGLRLGATKIF